MSLAASAPMVMAFGGEPTGVPMPPMEAAAGMPSRRARAKLPLALPYKGAAVAIIIAVVAVLLISMEMNAVASIRPSRTYLD